METSSERFYGLDHLRAIAIMLVLIYHYRAFDHPLWIDHYGRFGWTGVDLFFVLSGFLISNQLFKEIKNYKNINLKLFYIKRFFRIIPPYAATLFLYFCFPFFREREALPDFWKFITFTQNYGLDIINRGTFSHAWSLCIEEQFYLFLPLFLVLFVNRKIFNYVKIICIAVIICSILIRFISWKEYIIPTINSENFWKEWYMKIYYPTYTRLDSLGIGVLIGYLFQYSSKFKEFINAYGNWLFISGIVLFGISLWICNDQASEQASIYGFTFVAISFGLLVASAISTRTFLYRSKSYITSQIASLSYAVYLSHKGIIHSIQMMIEKSEIQLSPNIVFLICLVGCITGGLLYRFFIEKPSSKIKRKFINI